MARECILEAYHHHCRTACRRKTCTVLMDAVRERDEAWEAAKAMLGHDYPMFNTVSKKGKPQKRIAGHAPVKELEALICSLRLHRWRQEAKCENLLHLSDVQKKQVVDTLQTLIDKVRAWSVAVRDTL